MKTLVDTDVLIDFFKKKHYAGELIQTLSRKGTIAASILSITELRAGWNTAEADRLLPPFHKAFLIENLNLEIATYAGALIREYKRGAIDTLIASTAIIRGYQLVTRNKKDYPFSALTLYPFSS